MADKPKDYDFQPSWSNRGSADSNMNQYLPGGSPYMAAPGGNQAITGLMSQLSPLIASIGQLAGLDKKIVEGLTRSLPGILSTRGSIGGATNYADIMMNQATARQNRSMMTGEGSFQQAVQGQQKLFISNMYERSGMSAGEASKKADSVMGNALNPAGIPFDMGFKQFGFDKMQRGLLGTSLIGGVNASSNEWDTAERQHTFRNYSAQLATRYGAEPFGFGGLKGGDIGQLSTAMTQRGQLNFRDSDADPAKMVGKVKKMAQALGPLKELFNESIPELMDRLDGVFGVSSSTFSPDQIASKMRRMKGMASQTGVSMQRIMAMSQGAQQMMGAMGMSTMGADNAAVHAMGMIGSGVNLERLNPEQFRKQVLRDVVGQQSSQAAKELSGAAAIMMRQDPKKYKTQQEAVDALKAKLGDDMSLENMAKVVGVSTSEVVSAGMSERAEDIRTQTDVGTMLTESRYGDYKKLAASRLGYKARFATDPKEKAAYAKLAAAMEAGKALDEKGAQEALKGMGLSAGQMEAVLGTYRSTTDVAAGQTGFEGGGRGANAQYQAEKNRREIYDRVKNMDAAEAALSKNISVQKYGALGILTSKEKTVAGNVKDVLGLASFNLDPEVLETIDKKKGGAMGRLKTSFDTMYQNMSRGGVSKESQKRYDALQKAFASGDADAITKASDAVFLAETEEGKAVTKAAGFTADGDGDGKISDAERVAADKFKTDYLGADAPKKALMMKRAALRDSIRGNKDLMKAYDAASAKEGGITDIKAFLSKNTKSPEELEIAEKSLGESAEKLGLDMASKPVDILDAILKILQGSPLVKGEPKETGIMNKLFGE